MIGEIDMQPGDAHTLRLEHEMRSDPYLAHQAWAAADAFLKARKENK